LKWGGSGVFYRSRQEITCPRVPTRLQSATMTRPPA
jgi:hypothetical protein